MPKYGNSAPDPPKIGKLKLFTIIRSVLPICFQQALNDYLEINVSQDMSKNMFWAPNAQIWKFSPRPPKNGKIENFHHHLKRLTNTLPTSPQPLSADNSKPGYVQKHVLGPKCPNMEIQLRNHFIYLYSASCL